MKQRVYYLDNLKVFLTIMVVFHHAGQAYGDGGAWAYTPSNPDEYIPWLWRFFSVNSAYLMALYFMISAYFVPNSFKKQGFWTFLRKKFVRFGIPIFIMAFIATPVSGFFDIGHTWFLEQLLFYSLIYAVFALIFKRRDNSVVSNPASLPNRSAQPSSPASIPDDCAAVTNPASLPNRSAQPSSPASIPDDCAAVTNPASLPNRSAQPSSPASIPDDCAAVTNPASLPNRSAQPSSPASIPDDYAVVTNPTSKPCSQIAADSTNDTANSQNIAIGKASDFKKLPFIPTMLILIAISAGLSVASYYIRAAFSQDTWVWMFGFLRAEPAHFPQYILLFVMGLVAYRTNFLRRLSCSIGAVSIAISLFISLCLWFAPNDTFFFNLVVKHWFITDSVIAIFMCVGMLWLFRELFNRTNRFLQWCADNAYGAYLFHILIMLAFQFLIDSLWLGSGLAKFLFVGVVCTILSFVLTWLVRMIPGVKKVL